MATEDTTTDDLQVAELDDKPGAVYAFGIPDEMSDIDIEDLYGALRRQFEHAEFVVINLPIEGSVSIEEVDPTDLFDDFDGGE